MKKFTLLLALLICGVTGLMAQNYISLTFTRTGTSVSDVTVNATSVIKGQRIFPVGRQGAKNKA